MFVDGGGKRKTKRSRGQSACVLGGQSCPFSFAGTPPGLSILFSMMKGSYVSLPANPHHTHAVAAAAASVACLLA